MAVRTYGRLDVLHNNVALTADAWGTDLTVLDTPLEVWDLTFTVNLRSHVVATRAALPHLIRDGGGSIINMASVAGDRGRPALTAYGTSKAAVMHFTRFLAAQYGRSRVRSNCIAPGVVLTDQLRANAPDLEASTLETLPFHRVGEPEDIAGVVLFLASDDAAFVNGQVDPGRRAARRAGAGLARHRAHGPHGCRGAVHRSRTTTTLTEPSTACCVANASATRERGTRCDTSGATCTAPVASSRSASAASSAV